MLNRWVISVLGGDFGKSWCMGNVFLKKIICVDAFHEVWWCFCVVSATLSYCKCNNGLLQVQKCEK